MYIHVHCHWDQRISRKTRQEVLAGRAPNQLGVECSGSGHVRRDRAALRLALVAWVRGGLVSGHWVGVQVPCEDSMVAVVDLLRSISIRLLGVSSDGDGSNKIDSVFQ